MTDPKEIAENSIHEARMISPDHVRGSLCGQSGAFTRTPERVTCPACLEVRSHLQAEAE